MRPATLTRRQPGGSESCRTVGETHRTPLSLAIQAGCRRSYGFVQSRQPGEPDSQSCWWCAAEIRDRVAGDPLPPFPSARVQALLIVIHADCRRAWPWGQFQAAWGQFQVLDPEHPGSSVLLSRFGAEGITASTDGVGAHSPILRFVVVFFRMCMCL